MDKAKYLLFIIFILVMVSCMPKNESENQITVFCASSLFPIVEAIKIQWENNHKERIIVNSASSGTLARQLENGAPADIYLSANQEWMNYLLESPTLKKHPISIASNRLVVAAPVNSTLDSMDINRFLDTLGKLHTNIAIGDPGHVPLGKYTKQFMVHFMIYEALSSKLIITKDARSALRLVELGEAEVGFVYQSDAITSGKVKIVALVPDEIHEKIVYQGLLLDDSNPSSKTFMEYLTSTEVSDIWKINGFMFDGDLIN